MGERGVARLNAQRRQWLIGVFCVLCGASAGFVIGYFTRAKEMAEVANAMVDIQRMDAEGDAETRVKALELIEAGKYETLVRMDCFLLDARIQHLDPAQFGDRAEKVKLMIELSRAVIAKLQEEGRCPGHSAKP